MNFFLMGGTGFIGTHLTSYLLKKGHEVTALVRRPVKAEEFPPGVSIIQGDPLHAGSWQDVASQRDVIVNLVGKPILTRWTDEAREEILESRVRSTRLAADVALKRGPGITLINANAVGYYGDGDRDAVFTEESACGTGFLAEVTMKWQEEAMRASENGARVVVARLGAVLGMGGGMLAQMIPVFRLGVGGRLGDGRQWFSWIHIHDLCRAVLFIAANKKVSGTVNMCAPNPVTNMEFTKTLAGILGRPAILPVPGFALRLFIGNAADVALKGQRVVPAVLEREGFAFDFPTIKDALEDLLGKCYGRR
ncbi:MAG: TIGR01777 family oxidoreductase [Dissulfurimicrobium sp.]|uniref:TIGR01777 family oxidoreductase n=1 Tax=Dissulfurimicrobium sp. TaxID=2022436 RepID=UPI003D0FEF1C